MAQERDDAGFTLIELMVVVLIIAMLLAIAIPTFLGARERASDRAAQSHARNAHTAEMVFYADNQTFTEAAAAMMAVEPSMTYTGALADLVTTKPGLVYLDVPPAGTIVPNDTLFVAVRSGTGRCFWIRTIGDTAQPRFAVDNCTGSSLSFGDHW